MKARHFYPAVDFEVWFQLPSINFDRLLIDFRQIFPLELLPPINIRVRFGYSYTPSGNFIFPCMVKSENITTNLSSTRTTSPVSPHDTSRPELLRDPPCGKCFSSPFAGNLMASFSSFCSGWMTTFLKGCKVYKSETKSTRSKYTKIVPLHWLVSPKDIYAPDVSSHFCDIFSLRRFCVRMPCPYFKPRMISYLARVLA